MSQPSDRGRGRCGECSERPRHPEAGPDKEDVDSLIPKCCLNDSSSMPVWLLAHERTVITFSV